MKGNKPIAFRNPELDALGKGLRHFRRLPDGALAKTGIGDRLWIREPYFLLKAYSAYRPTVALSLGAEPTFVADVGYRHQISTLGRARAARELCRNWHRRHLVVTTIERQRLQDISEADLAAAGYRDIEHFAHLWSRDNIGQQRGTAWHDNPEVLRFGFDLVDRPLPAPPPRAQVARSAVAPKEGARRAALRQAFLAAPVESVVLLPQPAPRADGRTWCDQCQGLVAPDQGRACARRFCPLAAPTIDQEAA